MSETVINSNINVQGQTISGDNFQITIISPRIARIRFQEEGRFEDSYSMIRKDETIFPADYTFNHQEGILQVETKFFLISYRIGMPLSYNALSFMSKTTQKKLSLGEINTPSEANLGKVSAFSLYSADGIAVYNNSFNPIIKDDNLLEKLYDCQDFYLFFLAPVVEGIKEFQQFSPASTLPSHCFGITYKLAGFKDEELATELEAISKEGILPDLVVIDSLLRFGIQTASREQFQHTKCFLNNQNIAFYFNAYPLLNNDYQEIDNDEEHINGFDNPQLTKAFCRHSEKDGIRFGINPAYFADSGKNKNYNNTAAAFLNWKYSKEDDYIFNHYFGIGTHQKQILLLPCQLSWRGLEEAVDKLLSASSNGIGYAAIELLLENGLDSSELFIRYLALMIFSPITILPYHKNRFPFLLPHQIEDQSFHKTCRQLIQLRQHFAYYIQKGMDEYAKTGMPFVKPLRFLHNDRRALHRQAYYFGSDFLVVPITGKLNSLIKKAEKQFYLPPGNWFDYFTFKKYRGNKKTLMMAGLDEVLLLAKAGTIIPFKYESVIAAEIFGAGSNKVTWQVADQEVLLKIISNRNGNELQIILTKNDKKKMECQLIIKTSDLVACTADGVTQERSEAGTILRFSSAVKKLSFNIKLFPTIAEKNEIAAVIKTLKNSDCPIELKNRLLYQLFDPSFNSLPMAEKLKDISAPSVIKRQVKAALKQENK